MTLKSDRQSDGAYALLTGGGSGIGRAAAVALAAEGCTVTLAGRTAATLDYAGVGIRVNAVCPGLVSTPLVAGMVDDDPESHAQLAAAHPLNPCDNSLIHLDAKGWKNRE